ncbi:hypothetical protein J0H58_28315 [bacterium]|nr:hypothetical protein [bacterium]
MFAILTPDTKTAREVAASQGEGAFPSGRFVIILRTSDDADLYRRIRAALR